MATRTSREWQAIRCQASPLCRHHWHSQTGHGLFTAATTLLVALTLTDSLCSTRNPSKIRKSKSSKKKRIPTARDEEPRFTTAVPPSSRKLHLVSAQVRTRNHAVSAPSPSTSTTPTARRFDPIPDDQSISDYPPPSFGKKHEPLAIRSPIAQYEPRDAGRSCLQPQRLQPRPARRGSCWLWSHALCSTSTRQGSISIPQQPAHQQRPMSPSIGIQLDPTGRVVADDMAAIYAHQQPQPPGSQYRQPPQQPPPPQQPIQRRPSYNAGPNGAPYAPVYNAPPPQHPPYNAPPSAPQQPAYPQQPPVQGRPSQVYGYNPQAQSGALVSRGPSMNNGYYSRQPPAPRAPSPQPPASQPPPPTGQYTDDGRGVLFYVKAMYNYLSTIDEEFDFQEGDIIAVTATPEDGW
ncbi:hypothetical protein FKP32DRAFT_1678801 [Trametes sanguinea]|nr:hypothetical protein FKP32DRAFT_1678801 [Trametes sanguinea]